MFFKRYAPAGSRPGTLIIDEHAAEPSISVFHYTPTTVEEFSVPNDELLETRDTGAKLRDLVASGSGITWVDVQGLGREDVLRHLAEQFALHPLTIADVVNIPQRPKTETHDEYVIYIGTMTKLLDNKKIDIEQLSVVWGKNFVITFQERLGDILDPVRERIRAGKGPLRKNGSDYLSYAIIDTTIDGFYPILEQVGEQLEELEDEIISNPVESTLQEVYRTKRELLMLRRSAWPQREAISTLARDDNSFVKKATRVFFRDTYDHIIEIIDILETYRELAGSFMDVYLSSISNRMNEVMKVLTIMGTIFIPLSFFAGIYGMNFEYMPELHWKWAYPIFWITILTLAGSMLVYFHRKGWIGPSSKE